MKRLFTILTATLLTCVGINGQSNTMFMVEEGTQASCGPCAGQNPAFDALLEANNDKVVVLKYQTWWPGFDPMYLDNPDHVAARINYYGINGVPTAVGNGAEWANDCGAWPGAPACLSQDEIDAAYDVISPLTMNLSAQLVNGTLEVTGDITADQALSGNLKLRIALTEQTILYEDAPGGTNGETEYNHVMKTFVGGPGGISLDDMAMGDVYTINESVSLGSVNVYNYDQLEVVAFVQDDTDKQVYQAAKDQTIEIIVDAANNAAAGDISGTPGVICSGTQTLTPVFTLINGGSETLTSADIVYSANGGAEQTFNWTGSLETLGSEDVTVDPITFDASATEASVLNFMVMNPNGVTDEVVTDDTSELSIEPAPATENTVELTITTDPWGDEVYWEIRTASGIVAWGGNPNVGLDNVATGTFPPPFDANSYGNNQTYVEEIPLPAGTDCYTFHITDYFGDGLTGSGGYTLKDNNGNTMHSDVEDYQDQAIKDFSASSSVGISENELASAISIGPNPVNDILNVRINMDSQEAITIEVMNSLGQIVHSEGLGSISGFSLTEIDVKSFDEGMYYVNVLAGGTSSTTKFTVIK
ncbi:MAG: Omp28-related outer membrane protein [Flavobacteriales bacterium]|nr:Omp28-related outer membrane protein [Flavobacteriales bacterium]